MVAGRYEKYLVVSVVVSVLFSVAVPPAAGIVAFVFVSFVVVVSLKILLSLVCVVISRQVALPWTPLARARRALILPRILLLQSVARPH